MGCNKQVFFSVWYMTRCGHGARFLQSLCKAASSSWVVKSLSRGPSLLVAQVEQMTPFRGELGRAYVIAAGITLGAKTNMYAHIGQ